MDHFVELRRELHRHPELSGAEEETARRIARFFDDLKPDEVVPRLGGRGLAFVFNGADPGPTLLLRCELDALPIGERSDLPYRSAREGVAHLCGHDGHMAVLAAVGARLAERRPARGQAVLLFQPAEETGAGAAAVIGDPRFASIRPDFAFAWHNLPGFPLGEVIVREGEFSSASRGMSVVLSGVAAHAAQPETGVSPAPAMCDVIEQLSDPHRGGAPAGETAFATVVGARLGGKAFGTAPGRAEIWATLRSVTDGAMAALADRAEATVRRAAERYRLRHSVAYADIFPATVNSPRAAAMVRAAAGGAPLREPDRPFLWSEDFGHLASVAEGALFGIGAGLDGPDLHNPDYDFPEELIAPATDILMRIVRDCLR